jgi:predicted thioesterase/MFS family permease
MRAPQVGSTALYRHVVRPQDLATSWENDVPVLATPVLLWLAERASMQVLTSALADGEMTVGYAHEEALHLAATPEGWEITMTATLESVDRSRVRFRVEATDGHDVIYQGIHVRAVVQRDKLLARLQAKTTEGPVTEPPPDPPVPPAPAEAPEAGPPILAAPVMTDPVLADAALAAASPVTTSPVTTDAAATDDVTTGAERAPGGPPAAMRAFNWLWGGAAGATLADGIYQVALPIAALAAHGGATGVAVVYTATRAPWALCALHAGVLADRFDRRRLLVIANVVRTAMLLVGVLVTTIHLGGIAALAATAFVLGMAETLGDTSMHSITPRIVPKAGLVRAASKMQSTELLTNLLIGPSLGGLLAGIAVGFAFGSTALLYALSALSAAQLLRLTRPEPPRAGAPPVRLRDGLIFLVRRRTLCVYAVGVGVVNAGFAAFQTALPLVALRPGPLGLTPGGYGLLLGGAGVVGTLTALGAQRLLRAVGNRMTLIVGHLGLGGGFALAGLYLHLPVTICAVAATGTVVLGSIVTVSYRQRTVPDDMLGRVTAAYRLLAFGGLPVGSALAGVGAHLLTPHAVLVIAGAIVIAAGLAMAWVTPGRKEARP